MKSNDVAKIHIVEKNRTVVTRANFHFSIIFMFTTQRVLTRTDEWIKILNKVHIIESTAYIGNFILLDYFQLYLHEFENVDIIGNDQVI
jgi:hypothetical protein